MHAHEVGASATHSPPHSREERTALVIVVVASVWFTLAVSWGLFGRVAAGHDAVVAARGIIAENMLAWHIGGPVREYTLVRPEPSLYYAHHPWGTFWSIAALAALFGRHAYVPRLLAVIASAATPPLLYGIGRALWGPVPGALASLAYATLPMALAFGNFPGFEVPLVAACLLTTWGYVRFARTQKRRWMAVSLLGAFASANTDWEAHVFLAVAVFALMAVALFGARGWLGRLERLEVARWSWLTALVSGGTVVAYAVYFQHISAIGELAAQDAGRSSGNAIPLSDVLAARRYWIDVTFTPLAILVGKIALLVFLVRIVLLRCLPEIFPIAILVMAFVQYVKFKNGADVHIYWPLLFAPYYALSVGVLASSANAIARRALSRLGRERWTKKVEGAVFAFFGLIPLAILPDGIEALHYARMTGGRFNEKGRLAPREEDKSQALEWMAQRMEGPATVLLHEGMHPTWAQAWALHRPIKQINGIPLAHTNGSERYFIGDMSFMTTTDQLLLAHTFSLVFVGQYVLADRAIAPPATAEGWVFDQREPNRLEWYFLSGIDPIRTVRADSFATWELRDHYGLTPNPMPDTGPTSLEQVRIAHNAAVAAGDWSRSERYEQELVAKLDVSMATTFSDGTKLLGERYTLGVAPTLALYFLAMGPAEADYQFGVFSVVEARRFLSLVPPDDTFKSAGTPFALPPMLWRSGYIYVSLSEIRHRPGRERFFGYFSAPLGATLPRPIDRAGAIPLMIVR